jgi:Phasin protein
MRVRALPAGVHLTLQKHALAGATTMTKSSTSTDTTDSGRQTTMMPFGFDMLTVMTQPPLTVMTDVNSKLFEGMAAFAKEWGDFLNRRLAANMALPQQVAACKTANDMQKVYAGFFQQASAQCLEEVEQMTNINMSLTDGTLKAMQHLNGKI